MSAGCGCLKRFIKLEKKRGKDAQHRFSNYSRDKSEALALILDDFVRYGDIKKHSFGSYSLTETMNEIKNQLSTALNRLFEVAKLQKGDILVVGCSTSEVLGEKIGSSGSTDCAKVIFEVLDSFCKEHGVFLAAQCCEHLNRAIVIE